MAREAGLDPYGAGTASMSGEVYTDTGTGAYPGPPSEETYGEEYDPNPTGAVPGPPVSVTVESPPDHLAGPTGAFDGPPSEVTVEQHPGRRTKAVKRSDVEDKAVKEDSNVVSLSEPAAGVVGGGDGTAGGVVGGGDRSGGTAAPAGA